MLVTRDKSIKKSFNILCIITITICAFVFALNIIMAAGGFLNTNNRQLSFNISFPVIFELFLIVVLIILVSLIYYFVKKNIIVPMSTIENGVHQVKSGNMGFRINMGPTGELGEIACAFNDMTENLQNSYQKLKSQALELSNKNWELHESNSELEASYGQLEAIIAQLNEAEQKYHSLVRNIPEIVCVIENSGIISFVNHVCTDILGYEKADLVGRDITEFIDTTFCPLSTSEILSHLENENFYSIELSLIRKDGLPVITEAKFTKYVFNDIDMGLQAIIRDITERRSLEKEILQSNNELSILNTVSKSLTSTLDLDDLSNVIVSEITRTLEYPSCILSFIDNDNSSLYVKAYSGNFYSGEASDKPVFEAKSLNDRIVSHFIDNYGVLKADDLPEDWMAAKINKTLPLQKQIHEILFIPVGIKDKKFGMLIVGSENHIPDHQINLISSIANTAAVAIDNAILYETSKKYFIKTVDALIATVEAKDDYTEGHSQRVSRYAVDIAEKLGLSKEQIEDIKIAGMLHDIGKIGISDTILLKPGDLTDEEYEIVKQHPVISNKILYPVGFSDRTMKAIAFHHERFDGKGYPYGLSGNNISIEAQIIAVADAYDAMTSSRSYRKAMNARDAIKELQSNKATQFNPRIVDTFYEVLSTYGNTAC